jgi:type IV secretory pathway VirB10-like protein
MSVPGVDKAGELPLDELVQNASQQAVALAREQVDVVRRELAARASGAGPGVAMLGGGALFAALASGTGTAALILLLARRPRASAAALGVTGAYAGGGAVLARQGLMRLREAGPQGADVPVQDEPVQNAKQDSRSAKRHAKSAAKSPRHAKSAAKSPRQAKSAAKSPRQAKSAAKSRPREGSRPKPQSKTASARRSSGTRTDRTRRRASPASRRA